MSMAEVWAEGDAFLRAQVQVETWGHLAPEARKKYPIQFLWARSEYECGASYLIRSWTRDMPDSPWVYDDMTEYIQDRGNEGEVYLFEGTYMKLKNGGYRFSGKNQKVKIPGKE